MSKPDRDRQLQLGEQQLAQWGIPAHAGTEVLRGVVGRNAAADLAIAARLGAQPEAASVEALTAMEASSQDKLVRKEIRRSLYRLERRGLPLPQSTTAKPTLVASGPRLEGYLSAVDGSGDQLVWLVKPRPAGVAHVFAGLNDPGGLPGPRFRWGRMRHCV